MSLHSSTWIAIIIHNQILDNVVDINLKCSGYKFFHLENSLAVFWYVFFLCFPHNRLIPMWILLSLEMSFSFHNYTMVMVYFY